MDSQLSEIQRALGRIEGKQDQLNQTLTTLRSDQDSLTKRVNQIEGKLNWYAGAGGVLLFAVTFFKDKVLGLLS